MRNKAVSRATFDRKLRSVALAFALVAGAAFASAAETPSGMPGYMSGGPGRYAKLPEPLGYVSDHAGLLDAEWRARIRSVCQDLERKTGVELVVVTIASHAPYRTAQAYASALYEQWGIGTAQKDHGALLLMVLDERQANVTLGKALIPVIHPALIQEVGRQYLEPVFRNGRYGEGLYRATVALASAAQDVRVDAPPKPRLKGLGFWLTAMTMGGALAFLWWISRPDLRHPYARLRRGEFWSAGQGGFGGNFGGFGGGMSGEGLG